MSEYTPWAKHIKPNLAHPLLGNYVSTYANREDVRKAMNIPASVQAWEQCSDIDYHLQDEGSYWIYKVLQNKIRILKYSGDTDGAVPTYGTRRWLEMLNWKVTAPWRPWVTDG